MTSMQIADAQIGAIEMELRRLATLSSDKKARRFYNAAASAVERVRRRYGGMVEGATALADPVALEGCPADPLPADPTPL